MEGSDTDTVTFGIEEMLVYIRNIMLMQVVSKIICAVSGACGNHDFIVCYSRFQQASYFLAYRYELLFCEREKLVAGLRTVKQGKITSFRLFATIKIIVAFARDYGNSQVLDFLCRTVIDAQTHTPLATNI